jgi:hypothetical protein
MVWMEIKLNWKIKRMSENIAGITAWPSQEICFDFFVPSHESNNWSVPMISSS